jgi:WD40 repeat protein
MHVLRGHRAAVTHATFAPDGKRVLTESEDRSVRLWDTVTGRELTAVRGPDKSTSSWGWFTPDGKGVRTISRYGDVFATRILDRSASPRIRTWNMNPTAYDYDKLQGESCQGSGALSVDDIERTGLPMKPKRLNCPVKSTAQ